MKKFLALIIGLFSITCTVLAEDNQWVCLTEHANGFDNENGEWVHSVYRPEGKFIVKNKNGVWSVYDYSSEVEFVYCKIILGVGVYCSKVGMSNFFFHTDRLKFTHSITAPYIWDNTKASVTTKLGKCAPL